jgi:hypothetical protein
LLRVPDPVRVDDGVPTEAVGDELPLSVRVADPVGDGDRVARLRVPDADIVGDSVRESVSERVGDTVMGSVREVVDDAEPVAPVGVALAEEDGVADDVSLRDGDAVGEPPEGVSERDGVADADSELV